MTLQQIRIGSLPGIQYDDAVYPKSISTETPIECTAPPVDINDLVRLDDLGSYIIGPASSVDSNLVEFNGLTGKVVKDGGLSHVDTADAISKKHVRSHAVSSTSDHSDVNLAGLANSDLMQWNDLSTKWLPKSIAEVIASQSIAPGPVTISSVEDWRYAAAIADDGTKDLPTIAANYAAKCEVIISSAGVIDANATFMINSSGTVIPQVDSGNVVYNVDTDAKLCIGTAATQNPLTLKNRLGGAKNVMITLMYVKA